jgi:hypothetical protein
MAAVGTMGPVVSAGLSYSFCAQRVAAPMARFSVFIITLFSIQPNPQIDVWDLDLIDAVEPAFSLGGTVERDGKKKVRAFTADF